MGCSRSAAAASTAPNAPLRLSQRQLASLGAALHRPLAEVARFVVQRIPLSSTAQILDVSDARPTGGGHSTPEWLVRMQSGRFVLLTDETGDMANNLWRICPASSHGLRDFVGGGEKDGGGITYPIWRFDGTLYHQESFEVAIQPGDENTARPPRAVLACPRFIRSATAIR